MKTFRSSRNGPFQNQTFYDIGEVEIICTNALRALSLLPASPEPIRIDRFVEKKFNVTIQYESLSKDLYGYTVFGKNGVQKVVIANAFDAEGTQAAERKLRTTMAHEGGHGLLHTHLFCMEEENTQHLFADYTEPSKPKILCRDATPGKKHYDGSWWEYQANMAIGALLLPRNLMAVALNDMLESTGKLGIKTLPPGKKEAAARLCADIFNVNPAVTRIRIDEVWPEIKSSQMQL